MDTHGLEVELEAVQWSFGCKLDDVSQELVASAIAWIEQEVEKPGLSRRCDGQVNSNVARSSGVVDPLESYDWGSRQAAGVLRPRRSAAILRGPLVVLGSLWGPRDATRGFWKGFLRIPRGFRTLREPVASIPDALRGPS